MLASGRDVNVLVLDTEVYSNTGGQSSKATPLAAVAKFAAGGKAVGKKDLALQAISYGNVYVARVAMGADPQQTLTAFREAEAYDGPSLIIAYSHCIAHGIEMRDGLDQQYRAVASGHWPLLRYDPTVRAKGGNPFQLDSPRPRIPLDDYIYRELRYRVLRTLGPGGGRPAAPPGPGGRRPAVGDLRGDGDARAGALRRRPEEELMDLTTHYLGLSLRNPLVASASPLSCSLDRFVALADAGVGAVVLLLPLRGGGPRARSCATLAIVETHENAFGEAMTYFPTTARPGGTEASAVARYLKLIERAVGRRQRPGHRQPQRQHRRAAGRGSRASMQDAGAAAIELNVYFVPGDPHTPGRDVEDRHLEILYAGEGRRHRPVAVKLSPHFSSPGEMALRLDQRRRRRARAVQPLPAPRRRPRAARRSSRASCLSPPERPGCRAPWIAVLHGHVSGSLAATTGVERARTSPPTCSPAPTSS